MNIKAVAMAFFIPVAAANIPSPTAQLTVHQILHMNKAELQLYCASRATIAAEIAKPGANIPPTFAGEAVTIKQSHFTPKQAYQWEMQQCPVTIDRAKILIEYMQDISQQMHQVTKEGG